MAPTIADVMRGIEDRLRTISGLRVPSDGQPDQINPPAAVVAVPPVGDYHATMRRGRMTLAPTVLVMVSAAVSRKGQMDLAEYANPTGARSVVTAVEADRTLGGVAEDCVVRNFRPLGLEEVGELGFFGGLFTLTVITVGS
ncbi:hypothetical protein ACIBI0_38405 [Microbispora rosea]|uniref:hypothetical protein n=1 Tax=Microbispora rosea TaxID=58117 RepID=UPI0037BD77D9